ncbi:DNA repair protein rhp54 [Hordeum vulgare]|nr:DNA repair protein rhp54 [Hordeum vulgare]
MSTTSAMAGFHHHYPHASRFSKGMLAGGERGGADHARVHSHRPQRHIGGRWIIFGGHRKRSWETPADMVSGTCNVFNKMPTTDDDATSRFITENMIFKGGVGVAPFDPEETQSSDGRNTFMVGPFVDGGTTDPFRQGEYGMGTFPVNHEFPKDYDLEQDDEVDIDGAPLLEEELANQAQATKKRQSKQTKAYTKDEDKLLCEC